MLLKKQILRFAQNDNGNKVLKNSRRLTTRVSHAKKIAIVILSKAKNLLFKMVAINTVLNAVKKADSSFHLE